MLTIYEKETLIESLDETFTEIKAYVEGAIGQEALHDVEQHLFRRLQSLGRGLMETFVALSGSGYEAGNPPLSEEGQPLAYKGTKAEGSPYLSIFGEIRIYRAAYAHPDGGRVYPIDATLNLPAHKYSYLLWKWRQASSTDQDFRSAVDRFKEIFDFSFFPEVPQRQGLPLAASVESFYEQVEAPPAETAGSHIALSAEGKGVRILKSERAASPTPEEAKPRRGKGEKPSLKKDAVVVTDFSFDPEARDREEIVKGLLNQFTPKEKKKPQRIANIDEKKASKHLGYPTTSLSLPPSTAKKPPSTICWIMSTNEIPKAQNPWSLCWMAIRIWRTACSKTSISTVWRIGSMR